MDLWHKKIRYQVKYGAAHYWLGESISQSITEAGAFTDKISSICTPTIQNSKTIM